MIALVAALRRRADEIESASCTGLVASWCPVHGDCTCPRDDEGQVLEDERGNPNSKCPLHAWASSHATGVAA